MRWTFQDRDNNEWCVYVDGGVGGKPEDDFLNDTKNSYLNGCSYNYYNKQNNKNPLTVLN